MSHEQRRSFRMEVEQQGDTALVRFYGWAGVLQGPEIQQMLMGLMGRRISRIVLDLDGLHHLASMAIIFVVAGLRHRHASDSEITLTAVEPWVRDTLLRNHVIEPVTARPGDGQRSRWRSAASAEPFSAAWRADGLSARPGSVPIPVVAASDAECTESVPVRRGHLRSGRWRLAETSGPANG
jgi:hypothetical protein